MGLGDGPNLYSYVSSSPIKLIDPLGLQSIGDVWVYGEIRQYAINSFKDLGAPSGLADAKASIIAACKASGGDCNDKQRPNGTENKYDTAAWENIKNATDGKDQSGGGNFMCVGTQNCWFVTKCYKCVGGAKVRVSRPTPLTPSGTVRVGRGTVYFYKDPLQGWCNAEDRKSGCKSC